VVAIMMAFSFDLTPFFGSEAASISPSPPAERGARQGVEQGVRLVRNAQPRYFRVLPRDVFRALISQLYPMVAECPANG